MPSSFPFVLRPPFPRSFLLFLSPVPPSLRAYVPLFLPDCLLPSPPPFPSFPSLLPAPFGVPRTNSLTEVVGVTPRGPNKRRRAPLFSLLLSVFLDITHGLCARSMSRGRSCPQGGWIRHPWDADADAERTRCLPAQRDTPGMPMPACSTWRT